MVSVDCCIAQSRMLLEPGTARTMILAPIYNTFQRYTKTKPDRAATDTRLRTTRNPQHDVSFQQQLRKELPLHSKFYLRTDSVSVPCKQRGLHVWLTKEASLHFKAGMCMNNALGKVSTHLIMVKSTGQ